MHTAVAIYSINRGGTHYGDEARDCGTRTRIGGCLNGRRHALLDIAILRNDPPWRGKETERKNWKFGEFRMFERGIEYWREGKGNEKKKKIGDTLYTYICICIYACVCIYISRLINERGAKRRVFKFPPSFSLVFQVQRSVNFTYDVAFNTIQNTPPPILQIKPIHNNSSSHG